jgi:hypothetical protein
VAIGGALLFILGFVADLAGAFQFLGWAGLVGLTTFVIGVVLAHRLYVAGRLRILWRPQNSADVRTAAPVDAALALGLALLVIARLDPMSPTPAAPSPPPAAESTAAAEPAPPASDNPRDQTPEGVTPATDCGSSQGLNIYSHLRLASAPGTDVVVDVRTGGYVQQRFIAESDRIASIAVIIARPPLPGQVPFDPTRIGKVRLEVFRTDGQARNAESIPLAPVETGDRPNPAGIVQEAGENNEQTVFRLCPVKVEKGQRYAFRVTNEEPGVVLGFSLNTVPGETTSMDIIGTRTGQDRQRINYHQVAGYVCSNLNC